MHGCRRYLGAFCEAGEFMLGGLRGPDMLACLHQVPLDGFIGVRAVGAGRGEREAWPGLVVTGLDCVYPSSFHGVSGGCVEVFYEGACAGEIVGSFVGFHLSVLCA